jgi:hypothetical protein
MRQAFVFYHFGDTTGAMKAIADADEEEPTLRRQSSLRGLEARILLDQNKFDEAAFSANNALSIAKTIGSVPNLSLIAGINKKLLSTPARDIKEVRYLNKHVQAATKNMKLTIPHI